VTAAARRTTIAAADPEGAGGWESRPSGGFPSDGRRRAVRTARHR